MLTKKFDTNFVTHLFHLRQFGILFRRQSFASCLERFKWLQSIIALQSCLWYFNLICKYRYSVHTVCGASSTQKASVIVSNVTTSVCSSSCKYSYCMSNSRFFFFLFIYSYPQTGWDAKKIRNKKTKKKIMNCGRKKIQGLLGSP